MKFDVVVGNPPYQENDNGKREDGSANASASPIYHYFAEQAEKIANIQCLIIPARWLSGAGKGLETFSKKMLSNSNFKSLDLYLDSKIIFPNNDIKGGVCHFLKNNSYSGETNIRIHKNNAGINSSFRLLDENNLGFFIPYQELSSVLKKITKEINLEMNNIQKIVSGRKPYGLSTDFFKDPTKYNYPTLQEKRMKDDDIKIFGLEKGQRVIKFAPSNYPIQVGLDRINKYKVIFPYAYGSGEFGEKTPTSIIGKPGEINTETFLNIGSFDTLIECENLLKYINSKFFRSLIGILKVTQHSTTTFSLIPLQNFTNHSDINWSKSRLDIDLQLYNKYNLSKEEINFIEENVKEME